jgi:hypothetical protein
MVQRCPIAVCTHIPSVSTVLSCNRIKQILLSEEELRSKLMCGVLCHADLCAWHTVRLRADTVGRDRHAHQHRHPICAARPLRQRHCIPAGRPSDLPL